MADIPQIDFSLLKNNSLNGIKELAFVIKNIYTKVGFGYIVNHDIPDDLIASIFHISQKFYSLPQEQKIKIRQNKHFRGYLPLNESITKISTLGKSTDKPNRNESFIIAHDVDKGSNDYKNGVNLAGDNQWPEELPNFKEIVTLYNKKLMRMATQLLEVFEIAFGVKTGALKNNFKNPTTFLRLLHYPSQLDLSVNNFGFAPHTDAGFLTFLLQDMTGGLQIQSHNGEWIDVKPLQNALVLNTGDMCRRFTNNHFLSTRHRVITHAIKDRYSVAFFFDPNMNAVINALPEFCVSQKSKYRAIQYSDHLLSRLRANYLVKERIR